MCGEYLCKFVSILWFFPRVPWFGMQCVIVFFSDHTHNFGCDFV